MVNIFRALTLVILVLIAPVHMGTDENFYVPVQEPRAREDVVETSRGGDRIDSVATAYTWTGNRTFTGTVPVEGITVAVDPKVIPLHSTLEIYLDGECLGKNFKALDTGGVIKGNKIDIYLDTKERALDFGVRKVEVIVK